eukprot:g1810.t1
METRSQSRDGFLYFLGEEGSGKSTAIQLFLNPNKKRNDQCKRQGLHYTFAKKLKERDSNVKDIVHIWELSGPRIVTTELTNIDNIFLTPKQVTTTTVVIVLDLSKAKECYESALYWLTLINRKLQSVYKRLQERGSKLPDQLKLRAKRAYFSQHLDRESVNHTGIQVFLLGTKYEHFQLQEQSKKQILCRGLRFLAHTHGAHLMFMQQGIDHWVNNKSRQKMNLDLYRSLLNHLAFNGFEKKMISFKHPIQKDHLQPLFIPAGNDSLQSIGAPTSDYELSTADVDFSLWKKTIYNTFPLSKTNPSASEIIKQRDFFDKGTLNILLNKSIV